MPNDVISHVVCNDHKPDGAIPYNILVEHQGIIRCDKCERLASRVWFTPKREEALETSV